MLQAKYMRLANRDFRIHADNEGVFLWEIAAYLGHSEMWATRKLRVPMTAEDRVLLNRAVAAIAARKKKAQQEEE